tara:strand:+ start:1188 stop:2339 length:1152 start_codon:yes stop_codon:yes gene_type:complete
MESRCRLESGYSLGDFTDYPESSRDEFKELTLDVVRAAAEFSKEQMHVMLRSGTLPRSFNKYVDDVLRTRVCERWAPKYYACYNNADIKDYCELHIGVDDNGQIVGIPYSGKMPFEELTDQIYEGILRGCKIWRRRQGGRRRRRGGRRQKQYKSDFGPLNMHDIKKSCKIKFIELDIKNKAYIEFCKNKLRELLSKVEEEDKIFNEAWRKYDKEKQKVRSGIARYDTSVNCLLNGSNSDIIRGELIEKILEKKCRCSMCNKNLKVLKFNRKIFLQYDGTTKVLDSCSLLAVTRELKDEGKARWSAMKPETPRVKKTVNPIGVFGRCRHITPLLVKRDDIKYYILVMRFNPTFYGERSRAILYKDKEGNDIYGKRSSEGPYTVH